MNKIRIGIIFGGKSSEHKVSLLSAYNVNEALNKDKYEITLIGISREGVWNYYPTVEDCFIEPKNTYKVDMHESRNHCALVRLETGPHLISLTGFFIPKPLDVVFPAMHGTFGEDGSIQGLLRMIGVPFIGPSVLGSAVGMDKVLNSFNNFLKSILK
jgi:D-alanine-D-alanine ligase